MTHHRRVKRCFFFNCKVNNSVAYDLKSKYCVYTEGRFIDSKIVNSIIHSTNFTIVPLKTLFY